MSRLIYGLMLVLIVSALAGTVSAAAVAASPATGVTVLRVDAVGRNPELPPAGDVLSVARVERTDGVFLRVAFLSLETAPAGLRPYLAGKSLPDVVPVRVALDGAVLTDDRLAVRDGRFRPADKAVVQRDDDVDALWIPLPAGLGDAWTVTVSTTAGETVTASYPADKQYAANCALVLHGNQGLGYSDVFHGRGDDLEGSGFDEALQVHESTGVPGNFHLSGPLQTAAEWSANNGDPQDFNAWLAAGATAGWAGMVTSAYAQHIMPFVADDMNDWAVNTETQMIDTRYGYFPLVSWIPERVWLNTSGYPSQGVNDWIGDNFQAHGVGAVILDDDVHLSGHDNHRIHFLAANGLRLIPRDRSFTGNIVGGNGQASLDILTGLAGSGVGAYRIAVLAEDWEAMSEMGGWATITPNAKETYDWFVNKCATESGWLSTWKLADAISNANFNGDTFSPTPGTYNEIGGFDGYGGGDNGWYPHWAAWVPWVTGGNGYGVCAGGGNCKDYGTLWSDAFNALAAAPDNNVSQAGWYVMMTNLYETAWHDGMGGDISGWEHQYSGHIKQANIYAEAADWAAGNYAATTACYLSDIDNDGYDEVVMHNDRLFAVFEGAGGRLVNLFVRDGLGLNDTAIGSDNASWNGDADYNDSNHVGAFSDVSPNYQHDQYAVEIVQGAGPTVTLRLTRNEVVKEITLTEGERFLDAVYSVGQATHWVQSGFSPSLVDLVWNAQMDRIWAPDASYMGQRNPNTGVCTAWVVGQGGAAHQRDFSGTLMKGDEVYGAGVFRLQLFAGATGAPDVNGEVTELRVLSDALVDDLGPRALAADYYPTNSRLVVTFDQDAVPASLDPAGFALDENADDVPELVLDAATALVETVAGHVLTFALTAADAAALEALASADLRLLVDAGAVRDVNGVAGPAVVAADAALVAVHAATLIALDGRLDAAEWEPYLALADSNDSAWTASNELDGLRAAWDADYLYLAVDGVVTGNSWLLYIDVDPDGPDGETDLRALDVWERGALFTAPGFAADFQYGCYQHQSTWDGDSFWQITSPTTTQDRTAEVISAHDAAHAFGDAGGSELAIPWQTLYGLGAGVVPVGARISVVASICWDPEPDGVLGGDSAPSNASALLPTVDTVWTFTVDADADGLPDGWGGTAAPPAAAVAARLWPAWPNPFNPSTTIRYELGGDRPGHARLDVFNLRGERIRTLVDGEVAPGVHTAVWDGTDARGRTVAAGTYYCTFRHGGGILSRPLTLVK
jgi:hypothetical protein